MAERNPQIDLGNGHFYRKTSWSPDHKLNPQYKNVPDILWCGIILTCPHGITGAVHFIIPGHPVFNKGWTVESWEPLTISPSIASRKCGCHGFIKEGRWVDA